MEEIVSSTSSITNDLTNKDMVVIWGGTLDIGRNEANEALKQIKMLCAVSLQNQYCSVEHSM
jgi:hypothetical protein